MYKFQKDRFKHSYMFIYPVLYMLAFIYLEQHIEPRYIIDFKLDHYIPFCEYFIVPYLLWFIYMAATVLFFFFFLDMGDFYRMTCFLFSGMTIFLLISILLPNGLELRPHSFPRNNIFTDMVKHLYENDTSTNVLPSIHVFNSICIHVGIAKSDFFRKRPTLIRASFVLMVLIICSTMFLKQHSVLDVATGIALALMLYPLFYVHNYIPYRKIYPLPVQPKQIMVHHTI